MNNWMVYGTAFLAGAVWGFRRDVGPVVMAYVFGLMVATGDVNIFILFVAGFIVGMLIAERRRE